MNLWVGEKRIYFEFERRERERFLAQDSDSFNNLKIRQICTYVHALTNLKEIYYISRDSVQFSRERGRRGLQRFREIESRD